MQVASNFSRGDCRAVAAVEASVEAPVVTTGGDQVARSTLYSVDFWPTSTSKIGELQDAALTSPFDKYIRQEPC